MIKLLTMNGYSDNDSMIAIPNTKEDTVKKAICQLRGIDEENMAEYIIDWNYSVNKEDAVYVSFFDTVVWSKVNGSVHNIKKLETGILG